MNTTREPVPCGACSACCRNNLVLLIPEEGDDESSYITEPMYLEGHVGMILAHKPNGDCVYLDGLGKCSIWERAPVVCRVFDCRRQFRNWSREERKAIKREGGISANILKAGRERLHTLKEER